MKSLESSILKGLSEVYISIFCFDLEEDQMYPIKSNPFIDQLINIPGKLQDKMNNVMGKIAVSAHAERIKEFTSIDTLQKRMKNKVTIAEVFEGKVNGYCKARFIRIDDNDPIRYVLYTVECIDEEKRKEEYLRYQASTDLMTGILNRGYGEKRITTYLETNRKGMFILFDVDKFKRINDIYGHTIGDEVLISIAKAMEKVKREQDIIMRLGGDEFAAYFVDIEDKEKGAQIIQNLIQEISSITIPSLPEQVSVSLGAILCTKAISFEEAYKMADKGVYQSKLSKGSSYIFNN